MKLRFDPCGAERTKLGHRPGAMGGCSKQVSACLECLGLSREAARRFVNRPDGKERRPRPAQEDECRLPLPVRGENAGAGVRAYDISNPYQPREVAYFVPGAPKLSPKGAIQINDVFVDDRRIVYAADRFSGGLYILEMSV